MSGRPERASHVGELRASGPHLSVGINSADLADVRGAVGVVEATGARLLHIDVMDGHFVPQLTVGPAFVKSIRTQLLKDVHLMIEDPHETAGDYVEAGADIVTIHVESTRHPHRALRALAESASRSAREHPILRGIALNPGTPIQAMGPLLCETDYVLLLATDPGWRGKPVVAGMAARVAEAHELIERSGAAVLLGVDGDVTKENAAWIASLGPDVIVSGSAVFSGEASPQENLRQMLELVGSASRASRT